MAIPSEFAYITNIVNIYGYEKPLLDFMGYGQFDLNWRVNVNGRSVLPIANDYEHALRAYSYVSADLFHQHEPQLQYGSVYISAVYDILRLDVDTSGTKVTVNYSSMLYPKPNSALWRSDYGASIYGYSMQWISAFDDTTNLTYGDMGTLYTDSEFDTLQEAIEYIYQHYANIDLYVDDENWVKVSPITYNWQSVPSISGKNGILSLVTLDSESINDGEPVSGAAVSVFDQNPVSGNNVKDIVDGNTPLIPSAVDVTAAFIISNPPVGELASRILAAKKDSIPESIEDSDKIVDINPSLTRIIVTGLEELSHYYFVIFIEDGEGNVASSEPKDCKTGEVPAIFKEEVVVEKKIGDDEYQVVLTATGKWGTEDVVTEGFEVLTSENAGLTESQVVEGFEESYAENNWISEAQDAEIQT